MSRSLNRATLIGNVGADSEVRTLESGRRVATFSLATGRSWKDAGGAAQERTEWHRIVVWSAAVEIVEHFIRKGERVYVEGEIQYRSCTDGEGLPRQTAEVRAREILLLGGRTAAREALSVTRSPAGEEKGRARSRPTPRLPARRGEADDDLPF